jgi:hypothetical protein
MSGIVRLKWQRDSKGYDLVERTPTPNPDAKRGRILTGDTSGDCGTYIVPRSGKTKTYDISVREADVFVELANTPATPEGVLSFANKWGLLTKVSEPEISWFYRHRNELRNAIGLGLDDLLSKLQKVLGERAIARLDAGLERLRQHAPQLIFRCYTLRQFCWLEFVQVVTGGADIVRCAQCGAFLAVHKAGRPATYCSDACKQAAWRARRVKQEDLISPSSAQIRSGQARTRR